MTVSKGLRFALSMLGLDLLEWLVLAEIAYFDLPRLGGRPEDAVLLYFVISSVSLIVQIIGVILVTVGWYRLGGVLQVVSSAVHVPKGEGIIGVIGGVKAYRYPAALARTHQAA